jgi:xylulokinase
MTGEPAIIGLDVGTTVAKAVLFDLAGAELYVAEQAYPLHTPRPGWAELEPDDIWQAVVHVLQVVAARAGPGTQIQAIALATQGGTLIPCRADGTPTHRAITWLDGRSRDLAARWRAEGLADRIRQVSGWSAEPGLPLLSIGWLGLAHPEILAATDYFLSVNDFLAQRLTGHLATNPSMAGEMLLTDRSTGQWSDELCSLVGITPHHLSPILPSTAALGQLRPEVAHQTNLAVQTVIINGGQDHACEALALGLTSAGAGMLACGTAWVINAVAETAALKDLLPGICLNYHVVPGRWLASQFLGGLGACLEWWLNLYQSNRAPSARSQMMGRQSPRARDRSWASFDASLAETVPGGAGLLYLPQTGAGQVPGAPDHGGFVGLRLDHTRADMGRAILEGAAYELRWALAHLHEGGMAIDQLWMIGGAAQSPLWPQIVADVTGLPISLAQYTHGPALGAATLAGVGLGLFDTVEAGLDTFRVSPQTVEPRGAHAPLYDRQFAAYQQVARMRVP